MEKFYCKDSAHSSCHLVGLLNVQAVLRQEVQQCTDLKAELLHKWDQINKLQASNEVLSFGLCVFQCKLVAYA